MQQLAPDILERLRAMAEQQREAQWMLLSPSLVLKLIAATEANRRPCSSSGPGWERRVGRTSLSELRIEQFAAGKKSVSPRPTGRKELARFNAQLPYISAGVALAGPDADSNGGPRSRKKGLFQRFFARKPGVRPTRNRTPAPT
jgi:hypothetical protein